MPASNDFENKRRERRRRERLRKKRIRAAVIIIALIAVIVIVCIALSTCNGGDTQSVNNIDASLAPEDASVPTPVPVQTASGIPPAAEENDLLKVLRASGQTKHCYLTFDDGPTENITPKVLDVLRRYNVKATFFEVGSLIEANRDMARRVYEEGHLIANHSDGHNYEKLYASTDTFINEINKCYETIKSVGDGEEPFRLVRFPGGSYKSDADSYSPVKQDCKVALKDNGFYYCDWNALNGDAEGKKKNAQELLDYMKRNLDGEDNVVVLMHDAATKQATVDALPSIIEYFMSEGYTFHRLDDITYQAQTMPVSSPDTSGTDAPSANSASADVSPSPVPTIDAVVTSPSQAPSQSSSGAIVIQ